MVDGETLPTEPDVTRLQHGGEIPIRRMYNVTVRFQAGKKERQYSVFKITVTNSPQAQQQEGLC